MFEKDPPSLFTKEIFFLLSEMQTHFRELTHPSASRCNHVKIRFGRALRGPFNNLRSVTFSAIVTLCACITILISTSLVSWTNIYVGATLKHY
ncbi:hypothetical protein EFN70_09570 [Pediococcus ethanolidurans]|nr:hypothetical protein [Pediococcus ethanolidurans]